MEILQFIIIFAIVGFYGGLMYWLGRITGEGEILNGLCKEQSDLLGKQDDVMKDLNIKNNKKEDTIRELKDTIEEKEGTIKMSAWNCKELIRRWEKTIEELDELKSKKRNQPKKSKK